MKRFVNFIYKRRGLISFWRDTQEGNCQDYAWATLKLNTGGTWPALKAMLKGEAFILRARSPVNKWWWPRHAVLYYKGQWIDSTNDQWRDKAAPNKPLWPALPAPITIGLVIAAATAATWAVTKGII